MTALASLRLLTFRFDDMRRFWTRLLGEEPAAENTRHALFVTEGARVLLTRADIAGARDPETAGVDAVGLACGGLEALAARHDRLAAEGIHPELAESDGWILSLLYVDPDGNGVRLEACADGSPEALARWLEGAPLERAPLAVELDPARLSDDLRRGVPASALFRPGAAPNPHFRRLDEE